MAIKTLREVRRDRVVQQARSKSMARMKARSRRKK